MLPLACSVRPCLPSDSSGHYSRYQGPIVQMRYEFPRVLALLCSLAGSPETLFVLRSLGSRRRVPPMTGSMYVCAFRPRCDRCSLQLRVSRCFSDVSTKPLLIVSTIFESRIRGIHWSTTTSQTCWSLRSCRWAPPKRFDSSWTRIRVLLPAFRTRSERSLRSLGVLAKKKSCSLRLTVERLFHVLYIRRYPPLSIMLPS